jgi:hypothetical protein
MAREFASKEEFWRELDEVGEEEVRVRLAIGTYNNVNQLAPLAREWLEPKELAVVDAAARDAEHAARHPRPTPHRNEALHEALEARRAAVALRPTLASERRAVAARRSMWLAIAALVLAGASLVVSVVAIFRTL